MSPLFFFAIFIMVFSLMGLLGSFLLTRTSRATSERVLMVTQRRSEPSKLKRSGLAGLSKKIFEVVRWVRNRLGMTENAKSHERFVQAGFRSTAARDTYFATRMLGPILAVVVGSFIPSKAFFWTTVLGGIFYLGPDIVLTRLIKRHREKIRRSIPDAIDLLVICVDAGLGMDQAVLRVAQELVTSHPQIYEEFMQINREQRAGKLRLDAWEAMAERSKLQEIDGFVNMLMQTERFGTPIARALSSFGDGIRQKRRQRAEELAAKTTVKIIFPLVLFIFPSMFVVLLGPAAINIMRGMAESAR